MQFAATAEWLSEGKGQMQHVFAKSNEVRILIEFLRILSFINERRVV